ncbi:hypothetical protein [Kocuria sp.]|uniref:hypothetical protein n=1 Tax=Kocuria sp. TaxID=1871328 RepID=UPI0026E0A5C6|nr:hypothetical protein [Kocuria sp.]MDO5617810.1 hypothetical protein [Kocuria sp.]
MPIAQPYSRGFIVHTGTVDLELPQGWSSETLVPGKWVYSYDPSEPINVSTSGHGTWVLVHGLCLYAGSDPRSVVPAQRLLEARLESVDRFLDELDVMGGRYVVLVGDGEQTELYQDAMGMRSVYFSPSTSLVSSHVHLINDLAPHDARSDDQGANNTAAAWSRTPFLGLEALLPNHSLLLDTWEVHRFFPRQANPYGELSVQQRTTAVRNMWNRQMDQLTAQRNSRLVLSLTGGADSRTSLALSWPYHQQIETFTYTTRSVRDSKFLKSYARDKAIVDKLLDLLPETKHSYFFIEDKGETLDNELSSVVAKNTTVNHGAWLLPHYVREFGGANYVHLRGFGCEVGRAYWGVTKDNDNLDSLQALFLRRMERVRSSEPEAERLAYFEDGVKRWQYDGDLHGYHKRDLYYWEMRMGRWGSEVMNETDIAFQTLVGFNVRRILDISLSFPLGDRKDGFFYSELINAAHPILNFLGKNDVRNLYEITRDDRRKGQLPDTPAVPAVDLEPHLFVRHGEHPLQTLDQDGDQLRIPKRWFQTGVVAGRRFTPLRRPGDLSFTVTSRYGHPTARDYWRMQVYVNGRLRASWDGGGSKLPVHVSATDLQAGDVVEVSAIALTDQSLNETWSKASRAHIENVQFHAKAATGPSDVGVDHPTTTKPYYGRFPRMRPHDMAGLQTTDFPCDVATRVDIDLEETVVPLLVVRRQDSQKVLTLFNGAVDLVRSQGAPIFQRSSWWEDIPCSQIYVADPGSIGEGALSLSWGQVSNDLSSIPPAALALKLLAGALGVYGSENRVYFGSSAGGFWAWSSAVLDHGSTAVVNNAQIDWTRWMAAAVNELRNRRFEGKLPADLRQQHPYRTSVLRLWQAQGYPTAVTYWVNVSSGHDRVVDLPQVEEFARENPDLTANLQIRRYEDESSGHNPMSRSDTLKAIHEGIQE